MLWYEIKYTKLLSQIMELPSWICEENHVLIEEDKPSDNVVTIEEELDAADVDGIGNILLFVIVIGSLFQVDIKKKKKKKKYKC